MGELLPLDLGGIKRPVSQPVAPSLRPAEAAPAVPPQRNWMLIAMAAVIAFLLFLQFGRTTPGPSPEPTPDVDIAGRYMLLLVDESKRDSISSDQAPVLNSVKIADWCEENDVKYQRLDPRDDTSAIEDVWRQLAKVAADQPSMTTLNDGKVKTQPVPAGIDAAITELEKVFE